MCGIQSISADTIEKWNVKARNSERVKILPTYQLKALNMG